jgi:hypothetical protein
MGKANPHLEDVSSVVLLYVQGSWLASLGRNGIRTGMDTYGIALCNKQDSNF